MILTQLVNDFSVGKISSVTDLEYGEKMFVLIGTYWGQEDDEDLYPLEYFDEVYWAANAQS